MRQKSLYKKGMRIITHSAAECFKECRVKWDYRYNKEIVPAEPQTALDFGTAIHAGLEFWFRHASAEGAVRAGVEAGAKCGLSNENLCKVQVLLEKYTEVYKEETFVVEEVEKVFRVKLQNPRTLKTSRTFELAGKIDGLVRIENAYYILEHKTTSDINQNYIDALELKTQPVIYAMAMESVGTPIKGVIYDIIAKPGIKMATGETEEEFEARKAALLAKSKTGKTTAQRKEPETPDEFMARLREKVTAESYKRVIIDYDFQRKREVMDILWRTAQDMRNADIYPTTGACASFGKVCPYMKLCRKHGRLEECEGEYIRRKANSELEEAENE